jgi:hypothetical protein
MFNVEKNSGAAWESFAPTPGENAAAVFDAFVV